MPIYSLLTIPQREFNIYHHTKLPDAALNGSNTDMGNFHTVPNLFIYLLIYGLFRGTLNASNYKAPHHTMASK